MSTQNEKIYTTDPYISQPSPPPAYDQSFQTAYTSHPPTIIYQPTVYETRNQRNRYGDMYIETHLGWSVLNTICCLCVGSMVLFCSIPALIFSFKTQENLRNGNFNEAQTNSKLAHMFNTLATFLWVMIMIFGLFMVVFYTGLLSATLLSALNEINEKYYNLSQNNTLPSSTSSSILLIN